MSLVASTWELDLTELQNPNAAEGDFQTHKHQVYIVRLLAGFLRLESVPTLGGLPRPAACAHMFHKLLSPVLVKDEVRFVNRAIYYTTRGVEHNDEEEATQSS